MIAVIVVGVLGVIVAVACLIWVWRHKKRPSSSSDLDEKSAGSPHMQHHHASSSILSLDDAKRLATSFRQVLSSSDIEKKRLQVGEDILKRSLEAEGTSVVEVGQKMK
jgi:cytoskeletal protein RodZ